ncbi:Bifunctional epoxide hydrolase 2 [Grifola frondosa]|uniref:Bifunctional epoxide hydrolase 2 n=1 Tax=Grifola frondosa TaxID=5627 RepID=A0A1C7M1L1_GRIFR|nr:Bifunctional epoxide hydrolase 2 [Grifola frondosa]
MSTTSEGMQPEGRWHGLPSGISSRMLPIRDLVMHILEAGEPSSPLLILLHGFPELAISWRKIILPLAQSGYHVVAPDQRGYGRTTSILTSTGPIRYEDDLRPFRMLNLVNDIVALAYALGYKSVAAVIGHDFGSALAAHCALIRPDLFKSVVLMSTPFAGPPSLPFDVNKSDRGQHEWTASFAPRMDDALAALDPPRKHYTTYFSTPEANMHMWHAPQGLHSFLRGYFHVKSADWSINDPHPLTACAAALATMPHYYIMPLHATMTEVAQQNAPTPEEVSRNAWLPDEELAVYVEEFARTGFQGGLNRYRCLFDKQVSEDLTAFAGKRIDVPAMYLSGRKDWGVYQSPGALDKMQLEACSRMSADDVVLIEGAGHWVQQEQPEQVIYHLKRFLDRSSYCAPLGITHGCLNSLEFLPCCLPILIPAVPPLDDSLWEIIFRPELTSQSELPTSIVEVRGHNAIAQYEDDHA